MAVRNRKKAKNESAEGKQSATREERPPRSRRRPKTTKQRVAGLLGFLATIFFLFTLVARIDLGTSFGTGTGFNKAHISPVSVMSSYLLNANLNPIDKKEYPRLYLASKKICYNLAYANDVITDYVPESLLFRRASSKSSKSSRGKKGKTSESKTAKATYSHAKAWADKQAKDKATLVLLHNNYPLLIGAGLCIVGVLISAIRFVEGMSMVLAGYGLMYNGASIHPNTDVSYYGMYSAAAIAVLIYTVDTLKG
mmetsp:Transcript_4417/g.5451  ORF Transcript_4417/g.5451 Transcript_4417/m.5451 type:complete len:253 (+) Transcript_4417:100-858(+)